MMRKILIVTAYLLSAILVLGGTVVLVAYGNGYTYDISNGIRNGRLVHNGLLIVGSTPQGASIKLDGKELRRKTPFRTTLESGYHNVEIVHDGYRFWSKRVLIKPSEVSFVTYPFLLSNEIKTQPFISTFPVSGMAASRDRHRLAYMTSGGDNSLWVINLDSREVTKLYTPKAAADPQPAEVISEIVWSEDGSHILLKSNLGPKVSFLTLPAGGGSAVNLTELFGFDLTGLRFNPANSKEFFWISPEGLRKLSVDGQTVSAVLDDKVAAFAPVGDKVYYVKTTALGKSVWSLDRGGHKLELIQSLPESDGYEIAHSGFHGGDFLAIVPNKTNTVTLYSDVSTPTPSSKVISHEAAHVAFNDEGRYLEYSTARGFGVYDLEKANTFTPASFGADLRQLIWFDNFHLLATSGGKVELLEYDGANRQSIVDKVESGLVFVTADQRKLLYLNRLSETDGHIQIFEADIKK